MVPFATSPNLHFEEETWPNKVQRRFHSDAPPTALKDPSASAAGLALDPDDSRDLIGRTVTINVPRQALYAFWRDFRNLPLFMENIESVHGVLTSVAHTGW